MNKNTEVIHNARESLCNCTIELSGKNMLHARPSAKVKKIADGFVSRITISYNGRSADAKQIIDLLLLCVPHGGTISISADGTDAHDAVASLQEYFMQRFPIEDTI